MQTFNDTRKTDWFGDNDADAEDQHAADIGSAQAVTITDPAPSVPVPTSFDHLTYAQAKAIMDQPRIAKQGTKKLDQNTYLRREGDRFFIRLHNTDIIELWYDRTYLYSGGWQTVTTKARLNEYGPAGVRIWQERGVWYVRYSGNGDPKQRVLFHEGIEIKADGTIRSTGTETEAEVKGEQAKITAYAKAFTDKLLAGEIDKPGPGDCLFCQFVDVKTGKPIDNADHLRSHIEESYFVPSLLVAIVNDSKRLSIMVKHFIIETLIGKPVNEWGRDIVQSQLPGAIRTYLREKLGRVR